MFTAPNINIVYEGYNKRFYIILMLDKPRTKRTVNKVLFIG